MFCVYGIFVCMFLYLKILTELNPISDQIPVGYEITGVVTKGNVRCQWALHVYTQLYDSSHHMPTPIIGPAAILHMFS